MYTSKEMSNVIQINQYEPKYCKINFFSYQICDTLYNIYDEPILVSNKMCKCVCLPTVHIKKQEKN